jgi:hypothetical protein
MGEIKPENKIVPDINLNKIFWQSFGRFLGLLIVELIAFGYTFLLLLSSFGNNNNVFLMIVMALFVLFGLIFLPIYFSVFCFKKIKEIRGIKNTKSALTKFFLVVFPLISLVPPILLIYLLVFKTTFL